MNSKSIQEKIGSVGNWFTSFPEKFAKMPMGKKIYVLLWLLTGIMLIVTIGIAIAYGNTTLNSEKEAIAGVALAFVILLIAATTTTAIVSRKSQKSKEGKK